MKYPYFSRCIGSVESETFNLMLTHAREVQYGANLGFYKGQAIETHRVEDYDEVLKRLLDRLSPMLDRSGYLNSHINKMPPGTYIPEHSDDGENKFYQDNLIVHKVHIPILTNPSAGHMWRAKFEAGRSMCTHLEMGNIYLFNNIDIHSAVNFGTTDRIHWILRYKKEALKV